MENVAETRQKILYNAGKLIYLYDPDLASKSLVESMKKLVDFIESTLTLEELAEQSYRIAVSKGWDDPPPSFAEAIALIHSEASEALEEYRDGRGFQEIYYVPKIIGPMPKGIPTEFADLLIRIGHYATKWRIDISDAVRIKWEYNKTRPERHGGKAL